jgi:hypothetical protein
VTLNELGAKKKWKPWNTIVIQADFGESKTSADVVELESRQFAG